MTSVLGISAYYHDSAAALVVDGQIVAAAQEERFSRVKHDRRFPSGAIDYCLREAGIGSSELDYVSFYEKPLLKFDRVLETYCAFAPRGFRSFARTMPAWLKVKLHVAREIKRHLPGYRRQCVFAEHHQSHAASAFFPSPFDEAAILTVDGVGEWATATYGVGRGNQVSLTHEIRFPHSVGLLYSAFTQYCGFEVDSGEYKLMGLAPYGKPTYIDAIKRYLLRVQPDGSLWMDMAYFNYCQGRTMTSAKFHRLFGGPPRAPDAPLEDRHLNLAASIQKVIEEILLCMSTHLQEQTGMRKLCLAGGVALNCVANGRVLREGPFDEIWIQPAAGDAGGALGAALLVSYQLLGTTPAAPPMDAQRGSLLGPDFDSAEIGGCLKRNGTNYQELPNDEALSHRVAGLLAEQKIVGWFQGHMEFGPRALGNRSILADPRDAQMQEVLNRKIKFRESFRPFAPAVLAEHTSEYFQLSSNCESPYMLLVADVCPSKRRSQHDDGFFGLEKRNAIRSSVPAVTHVDYSARVQTVDEVRFPHFAKLLRAFHNLTSCPLLVSTSFNVRDEPIVCTPQDALNCFLSTDMDVLVMGRFVLLKEQQPDELRESAKRGGLGIQPRANSHRDHVAMLEIDRDPTPRTLLLFGVTLAVLAVILAIVAWQLATWPAIWWSLAALTAILACGYFAFPKVRRALYLGWMYVNFPIAWTVSFLALAIVYYVVLCPIGLIMRLLGRDVLRRRHDDSSSTYWHARKLDEENSRYFQSF